MRACGMRRAKGDMTRYRKLLDLTAGGVDRR